jgi:glycosyltransferase involved in cell wall biosynthesis
MRKGPQPTTFVTETDLNNVVRLAGFEIVRWRRLAYVPWRLLGLGTLVNWLLPAVPGIRAFGLAAVVILRPQLPSTKRPSLSVVIPARNEKGNIENALKRMPDLRCETEIIFVEGHSTDGTWDEILRAMTLYSAKFKLKAVRQTGKGKGDAVRLGFAHATGEVLTILDADLTMTPELLGRFYDAYCQGLADFVNGTRLVYPMEGAAMRPLNHLGNIFFAKTLSAVLGTRLGDSLCGTKLLARHDYERMVAWRKDFGDFDPFGDFELLFPASVLALGIIDIPIRYRAREYGTTNIHRFRHGLMLLKMAMVGLFRIRIGQTG